VVPEVRGRGLWAGIEIVASAAPARAHCETLLERGVLAKDTHETTIRLAPPLVISEEDLDWSLERILGVLEEAERSLN
jgi:ornithine--oxo-acid transaminase